MAAKLPDAPTYENYERRIPHTNRYKLGKMVDFENEDADLHLNGIAQVMRDWEGVAPWIGIRDDEIPDIKESNRPSVAILQKWKRVFGSGATYGVLLEALISSKNFDSADVIVKLLSGQPADGTMAPQQGGSVPRPADTVSGDSSGVLPPNKEGQGELTEGIIDGSTLDAPTYHDYKRRIPHTNRYKLGKMVDFENEDADLHLNEIAQVMKDWEGVAPWIGIRDDEISDIKESNRPSVAFLQEWKGVFGSGATYGVLLEALISTKNFDSADVIVKLLGGQPDAQMYESRIPLESRYKLDKKVDFENQGVDLHLTEIAQVMRDWEDVAPLLRLTLIEITDIKEAFIKPRRQRVACLLMWKRKFGSNATYRVLLNVLISTRNFDSIDVIVMLLGGQPADGTMASPQQGASVPHPGASSQKPAVGAIMTSQLELFSFKSTTISDPNFFRETAEQSKSTVPDGDGLVVTHYPSRPRPIGEEDKGINFSFGFIPPRPQAGEKNISIADAYKMFQWPHGVAVIINNEMFPGHYDEKNKKQIFFEARQGTHMDEKNLILVLLYLGYEVKVHKNCSAEDIKNIVEKYRTYDHSNYDSFICCILSHGSKDSIYGTDCRPVSLQKDIFENLNAENCKKLAEKPKIFFLQCCQGSTADRAVLAKPNSDSIRHSSDNIPAPAGPRVASTSHIDIPSFSDFYFSFATPRDYIAWRSKSHGSWYVSELCRALASYAKYSCLDAITKRVNKEVREYACIVEETGYIYRYKQSPEVMRTTKSDIFFF